MCLSNWLLYHFLQSPSSSPLYTREDFILNIFPFVLIEVSFQLFCWLCCCCRWLAVSRPALKGAREGMTTLNFDNDIAIQSQGQEGSHNKGQRTGPYWYWSCLVPYFHPVWTLDDSCERDATPANCCNALAIYSQVWDVIAINLMIRVESGWRKESRTPSAKINLFAIKYKVVPETSHL